MNTKQSYKVYSFIWTQLISLCFYFYLFSRSQLSVSFPEFQSQKHSEVNSMREFQGLNKTTQPPPRFGQVKQCTISGKILIQVCRGEGDNGQLTQRRVCVCVGVYVWVVTIYLSMVHTHLPLVSNGS